MAFENMTALELHLHLGGETEPEDDKTAPRIERPFEDDQSSDVPKPIVMLLAAVFVSITLSILVTLVVRWFKSDDGDD